MTHGTVKMVITLIVDGKETDYKVKPLHPPGQAMRCFELSKVLTKYRVWECSSGTHCSCIDYERNEGHDGKGCKHVRALRAYGMVE